MDRLFMVLWIVGIPSLAQVPIGQKESNDYAYYFEKGERAFDENDLGNALVYYNESIHLNPLYPDAYFSRAVTKEKLSDIHGAIIDYTLYLELNPDQFDALFHRALLHFKQSDWHHANKDFQHLIHLPGGETTSIYFRQDRFISGTNQVFTSQNQDRSLLFNYLGLTFFELQDFPNALAQFDSAILHNPNEADYLVNAARCHEALGQNDEAGKSYQSALSIDPEHAVARHNLSILNRNDGDLQEATKLLNDVISKNPGLPYPYAERAFHEMNNGELTKALADYNEAIRLSPETAAYWNNRGMVKA
ncbi:MAG TPA: tetratricopeptide repeat protein, partial [Cyclobacteriaceae bacterium]|nr:tetratricopeptide repeat protein [Cyclobacteriaceae bacterium]